MNKFTSSRKNYTAEPSSKMLASSKIKVLLCVLFFSSAKSEIEEVFSTPGDLSIVVVINNKPKGVSYDTPFADQSLISSAIWTTQRLNFLEYTSPLDLGLKIYKTDKDKDNFKVLFDVFHESAEYVLGVVGSNKFSRNVERFAEVLNLGVRAIPKLYAGVVKTGVVFLNILDWTSHVTVFAPNYVILDEFSRYSRRQWICVTDSIIYGANITLTRSHLEGPIIFFGEMDDIVNFRKILDVTDNNTNDSLKIIFAPTDGSVPNGLPENSYVIIPPQRPLSKLNKTGNILPTPVLFEVAQLVISYATQVKVTLHEECSNVSSKLDCLTANFNSYLLPSTHVNPNSIMNILKLEPLKPNFVYNVYRVEIPENLSQVFESSIFLQPYNKVFSFNIFTNNLTLFDVDVEANNSHITSCKSNIYTCLENCKNFQSDKIEHVHLDNAALKLRREPWVLAFLAVSTLGILFCVSILIFFLYRFCKGDIFEGNPTLTIILIFVIIVMYCSVIPVCLSGNESTANILCISKFLSITLSFAAAFSLLLSRSILIATASKEVGFISHVAGSVQAFLSIFIFGVQAALSFQFIDRCDLVFVDHSFILLISYNVILIVLLFCLIPFIYGSQRNYREGKYFTIAICLIICAWSFWLSMFYVMEEDWKEPMLCLGLVTTASVFVGAIFIPRTYLMTVSMARNKITSTFPSLATGSTMDIYRTNSQPIYDCVNVATINAVNLSRNGINNGDVHPNMYTSHIPDDDSFDIHNCATPPIDQTDKVTRF